MEFSFEQRRVLMVVLTHLYEATPDEALDAINATEPDLAEWPGMEATLALCSDKIPHRVNAITDIPTPEGEV